MGAIDLCGSADPNSGHYSVLRLPFTSTRHSRRVSGVGGGGGGGGGKPPNLRPSMAVIRNAKLYSGVLSIDCVNLCTLLHYRRDFLSPPFSVFIHCFCYHVVVNKGD